MTVIEAADDLAAVLDDCGVSRAVIYGTSYGSYLAQAFGVRHPDRVAGMVLDSTILEADKNETSKTNMRRLFWDGNEPETKGVTAQLRYLVESEAVPVRQTGPVVQTTYEFGGLAVLERMADNVRSGRLGTWNWVAGLGERELTSVTRHVMEGDLVAGIAFGELGFGLGSDGLPLDPNVRFGELAADAPPFIGEAFDLPASLPEFDWPTAVVSGERDMRSPRVNAERAAELIPGATLVPFDDLGHSLLDTHPLAALHVAHAVAVGAQSTLPELAPRIAALPRHGSMAWLGRLIDARVRAERLLPR
ncbi:alpha/beta hydrolase [Allosaccharopolyspora coralli]|uniref:alpha/beta hydrolase n=1 Tax=Allosaccharopolyspora coralli TaxID=2665642 RepID=UPI001651B8A8|nr:alpha/beta hydrolase [Allosaccharopolyspora coralli]